MSAIYASDKQTLQTGYTMTVTDTIVGNVTGCLGAIAIALKVTTVSSTTITAITASATNRDTATGETNNGVGQTFTPDPATSTPGNAASGVPALFILYPAGGMPVIWPSMIIYLKSAATPSAHVVKVEAWPIFTDPTKVRGGRTGLQQLALPS